MSPVAGNILIDLRRFHLLEPEQFDELTRTLAQLPSEPKALAQELMRRGWLTPFQVNRLLQGRGQELLLGSYILLERLGEGGMGAVFKARNWKLGVLRALKIIRKDRIESPHAVQRFLREMRAAAQLSHPNVVHAHDADEVDGTHLIAMELLSGVDLGRRVADSGPLPVEQACEYVRQAALGLQHAHERGMVHRDVKPSNLLVTSDGVVKILDLGLARLASSGDGESSGTLTQTNSLMGTPDYMAPEQARQSHTVDGRADLFSLGATMYFLLTGRPPFARGSLAATVGALLFDEAEPVTAVRPETPPAVAAVVSRLLAKDPAARYQTAAELAEALAKVLSGAESADDGAASAVGRKGDAPDDPTVSFPGTAMPPAAVQADTVSGLVTLPVGPDAARKPRRGRQRLFFVVAFGVVLAAVAAAVVARWFLGTRAPATGKLVVQCADPDVRVVVRRSGQAEADEHKVNETLELAPGEYELQPSRSAPPGLRVSPRTIRISSGGSETVRVEGFPLSADALVSRPAGIDGVKSWTIEIGGARIVLDPLALSTDGRWLAGAAPDGSIEVFDGRTGEPGRTLAGPAARVLVLAWSPGKDGATLASAGTDGIVRLWDAQDGAKTLSGSHAAGHVLAWTPDGKALTFTSGHNVLHWPAPIQPTFLPRPNSASAETLAWSPDGKVLAEGDDNALRLWRPPDAKDANWVGEERAGRGGAINALAWSPDGSTVASANNDGTVGLWDLNDPKKPAKILVGPKAPVTAVTWLSSDPGTVVSMGEDGALRYWDAATGDLRRTVVRESKQGTFSPDGGRVVAGGGPWTARLWETATGRPLGTLVLFPKGAVVLSDDGHYHCYGDTPEAKAQIEGQLTYVVQTAQGTAKYTPENFASTFNWKNDPEKARLDPR